MIEKMYGNKCMVTCDNCGTGRECDNWADVIDFMNEEGWKKRLVDGEFEHYCPECQKMSNTNDMFQVDYLPEKKEKRLTKRDENGNAYYDWGCLNRNHWALGRHVDRLAAYEDSGLSPEEVQELAKAKADGRLVVLPCKIGDTVYHRSGQHTIDDIQLFYPRQNGHVPEERIGKLQIRLGSLDYAGFQTFATYADEIGKTVFLSREEAEKALGGGQG